MTRHSHLRCWPTRSGLGRGRTPGRPPVAVACVLALALVTPGVAAQEEPDSIEEAKEQRDEAKEEQLRAQLQLDVLEAEDIEVVAALDAATELVALQEAKLDRISQRIDALDASIADAEAAIAQTRQEIAELEDAVSSSLVDAYVDQQQDDLAGWLAAADATTAAGNAALVELVQANGADLVDRLRAVRAEQAELLETTEAARQEIGTLRLEQEWALEEREAELDRQQELKAELDARRATWEAELAKFEQEEADLNAWIAAEQDRLEAEIAAQSAAAASAANPGMASSGGGGANVGAVSASGYQWPTSGSVGSGFGMRLHPILGYYRMHYGQDIGGAAGQPIWAAKEGVVIAASWQGGFGNAVIIAHEDGLATLYAHMTSFAVSTGQTVGRGAVIGYVGSTGLSTGPHLHFEVHQGGTPVDPAIYLP